MTEMAIGDGTSFQGHRALPRCIDPPRRWS